MSKKKDSLGVVIVNYNAGPLLNECINSVLENQNPSSLELNVVVIDNASSDESLKLDLIDNSNLTIIKNEVNKGFGAACNQGVSLFKDEDYILFLNPDTIVNSIIFEKSILFLKNNKEVSIMGVLHRDERGVIKASCSRKPIAIRIIWDVFGLSKILPKIFKPATVMSDFDHKTSRFVDQVMGAYMFMEKKVVDEITGFDERFFVYYEDADFALRASQKGYRSYYNSDIHIVHHGRGTTAKISDVSLFYNLRSRAQFVLKHEGVLCSFVVMFFTITIEPFTRILHNLLVNPKENKNTVKAFKLLYKSIFKI